ncbi:MAG: ion transporter [Dictyoglomi bacterium]|nr:ion transporter [Dictyoglomota bacterium]
MSKEKIFYYLEISTDEPVDKFFAVLIITNVIAVIISTVDSIYYSYRMFFDSFETFSVFVFTAEYILRLWSCTVHPDYSHHIWGRIRYALKPLVIVDLLSIFPFYLPLLSVDLRILRILRIFRILRILKLERYFRAMSLIVRVLKKTMDELVSSMIAIGILLIIVASLMYYIEPETFHSIPEAMWWGIVTLSTVGYGDVYPQTALGKIVGSILAILGIGLFGLPAGILASGFIEELRKKNEEDLVSQ